MKYAFATVVLAASVAAQANLPACATTCAINNFSSSGCSAITDIACLCRSSAYQNVFATCLTSTCSQSDQQLAATVGTQLCASAGVTLGTPSATGSASASASSIVSSILSSSSSASASMSSGMSSSMSSSSASRSSSVSASLSSVSASLSSASASLSSAMNSAASVASTATSRAAAPTQAFHWEVLGLGAAAAAAFL